MSADRGVQQMPARYVLAADKRNPPMVFLGMRA